MKINSYQFTDVRLTGWRFSRVEFGNVSLLVGDSGAGKTRLLNTLFNLGVLRPQNWTRFGRSLRNNRLCGGMLSPPLRLKLSGGQVPQG